MLEALALANGAYAIIKQTIQNGRELSSAGSAIAKFVNAEDQLQQDLHKKRTACGQTSWVKQIMTLKSLWPLNKLKKKNKS